MKNSSSLGILLIEGAVCINRGHLEALCLSVCVCERAHTPGIYICACVCGLWVFRVGDLNFTYLSERLMDAKLYQFLSMKQPNKLLKNDKDP